MAHASSKELCIFCRLPKANSQCEICEEPICRTCAIRLSEDTFAFMKEVPETLSHSTYCPNCHASNVEPALESYNEILERAKNVYYWPKSYRGNIPVIKKHRFELHSEAGKDRDDVLLRLAFQAAELGFNGLVRGEIDSKKLRDHGYQKMTWTAKATPVKVDEGKLEREEYREAHWRTLHHS